MIEKEKVLERIDFKQFYSRHLPNYKNTDKNQSCPFHEDKIPSLSIDYKTGKWFCHACKIGGDAFTFYQKKFNCDFQTALKELAEETGVTLQQSKKIVKTYDYFDEENKLLFQIVRYAEPKDFRPRRPDKNDNWIWNLENTRRIIYNLPNVLTAERVFVCEGEKDCDALCELGLTATTNPFGAGKWCPEYNQYFKDKKIVIFPDFDEPGIKHGLDIATNLEQIAGKVKIILFPELDKKQDVSDWINHQKSNNLSNEEIKIKLLEVVKNTQDFRTTEECNRLTVQYINNIERSNGTINKGLQDNIVDSLPNGHQIAQTDVVVEWLFENILPANSVTVMYGIGGIGKTTLSLQISAAIVGGEMLFGLETKKSPVFYIDFENSFPVIRERIINTKSYEIKFWHTRHDPPPYKLDDPRWAEYKKIPSGCLIVFDTLRASHNKDENDSQYMAKIMGNARELRDLGNTVLLLHHTPKSSPNIYKGSTAISDLADHILALKEISDDEKSEGTKTSNCLYFGTKIKTRYGHFNLFLEKDEESKLFKRTNDPTKPILAEIATIIGSTRHLSETELVKAIISIGLNSTNDMSDYRVRSYLKKGLGNLWIKTVGEGKNSQSATYILKADQRE